MNKKIIIYISNFSGILFNSIEMLQKKIYDNNIMIYFNSNFRRKWKNNRNLYIHLLKRYKNIFMFIEEIGAIKNFDIISNFDPLNISDIINNFQFNNLYIYKSMAFQKWVTKIHNNDIYLFDKIICKNDNIYLIENKHIKYKPYPNEIVDKIVDEEVFDQIFPQKNILNFTHGIYPKYYNENLPKVNKYYMYLNSNNFYGDMDNLDENYQKDIEKTLQWCKQNNIDVDVNIPCINPAFQYNGLIYCKSEEYCSRLINEFLYYKKPIWIMKYYNNSLDYYIPNAKNMEYPFLLKRDYIEIDVENRFMELVKNNNIRNNTYHIGI